jgi:hypothetical protein
MIPITIHHDTIIYSQILGKGVTGAVVKSERAKKAVEVFKKKKITFINKRIIDNLLIIF